MDAVIAQFLKLLWKAAQSGVAKLAKGPIEEFKLKNKLSESVEKTLSELQPYFDSEGIASVKQEFLLEQCLLELKPLLKKPNEFLRGSLDGQTLYQRLYGKSGAPQAIREERLDVPFRRVFPKIADRFNAYLPLTDTGKALGMIETLRRFDEINAKFAEISAQILEYSQRDLEHGDQNFHILHGIILESVLGSLRVTGLLGKYQYQITLEDIFVLPALARLEGENEIVLNTPNENSETLFSFGARTFVQGQPGAGKTTWTCWLQSLALKRNPRVIAIRLRFRDYPKGDLPSYYDLVRSIADPNLKARLKDTQIDQWIAEARLLFLLDGFDEVAPGKRKLVRQWIDGLHKTVGKAPIILTSRPLSTEHLERLPKLWLRWIMRPFNQPRVENYIARWYKHHPHLVTEQRDVEAHTLAEDWQHDPSLKELTGNPLMLGTLLTVHQHEGKTLPRGRAELYEKYLDGMLGPWEQNIAVKRDLDLSKDQKLGLLKGVAYHMLLHELDTLGEEDEDGRAGMHTVVDALIEPLHIQSPEGFNRTLAPLVLSELRERTGMLDGPAIYSFVHKSIGEFLFAKLLNDGHEKTPDGESLDKMWLFARRHDDRWRGVLYFWAGLSGIKDLQRFVELLDEQPGFKDMLLGLGLLYDQLDRLPRQWVRSRILKLKNVPVPMDEVIRQNMLWGNPDEGFGHTWEYWRANVPMPNPKDVDEVLRELIESAGIRTDEFADASPVWQSKMWFVRILQVNGGLDELELLSSKLNPLNQKGERGQQCLLRLINQAVESHHSNQDEIGRLLSAVPGLAGKAAIIWACAISGFGLAETLHSENPSRVVPLLRSLPTDPNLLRATKNRQVMFAKNKPYDPLEAAERVLRAHLDGNSDQGKSRVLPALGFVQELLAKRAALIAHDQKHSGEEAAEGAAR